MEKIKIERGKFPVLFGGLGFQNNEAILYPITEEEHFNQVICKCYREISPGYMRTFAGYDDWSKESMDAFAEYYEKMQKWTDTPMYFAAAKGKIHFSDDEIEEYCENVAENLMYLKKEKGVDHIRWYCVSNEMSQGTWGDFLKDLPLFKKYHEKLFRAFQNRKLDIGLLATDASEYWHWDTMDWAIENMDRITEDYCLHIYEREHSIYDTDFYDFFYKKCNEVVMKAIRNDNKRVILGEIGMQKKVEPGEDYDGFGEGLEHGLQLSYGNGIVVDVNRYHMDDFERAYYGIGLADMMFAAINAGIFAVGIWSYIDYPDPYSCAYAAKDEYAKKWGMIEKFISGTTDTKYNKNGMFRWEDDGDYSVKEFYWCFAPLIKLFKRNSKVLTIHTKNKLLHTCGIMNRDGSVSVGFVNRNKEDIEIELDSNLFKKNIRVYEYDPRNVPFNKFADIQDVSAVLSKDNPTYKLKAESVTFFTTDYKEKENSVFATGIKKTKNNLTWNEVSDQNHCYYRVYASKEKDFTPTKENQIASTVATSIPIEDKTLNYKILSVDTWGNV